MTAAYCLLSRLSNGNGHHVPKNVPRLLPARAACRGRRTCVSDRYSRSIIRKTSCQVVPKQGIHPIRLPCWHRAHQCGYQSGIPSTPSLQQATRPLLSRPNLRPVLPVRRKKVSMCVHAGIIPTYHASVSPGPLSKRYAKDTDL